MNPEKRLEIDIIKAFHDRGWYCRHFDVNGQDGWPDLIAFKGESYRLIECKAGTALRPSQKAFHRLLLDVYGVPVTVVERLRDTYVVDGEHLLDMDAVMYAMGVE